MTRKELLQMVSDIIEEACSTTHLASVTLKPYRDPTSNKSNLAIVAPDRKTLRKVVLRCGELIQERDAQLQFFLEDELVEWTTISVNNSFMYVWHNLIVEPSSEPT